MTTIDTDSLRVANDNHIIMVDDNDADIYIAKRCHDRANLPNPWLSFSNGEDFLAYLGRVKRGDEPMPALVLLDLNMPGMSGLEVLEETRADSYFVDLPIFCMLTGSSDPREKERAASLGAAGFVTKPDDVSEYVAFFESLAE